MQMLRSVRVAGLLAVISLALSAEGSGRGNHPGVQPDANPATSWLVFVDDLHLSFRQTGDLRELLRATCATLVGPADLISLRSNGPSAALIQQRRGSEREHIESQIKKVTGSGLRPSDVIPGVVRGLDEKRYRFRLATATAALLLEEATGPSGLPVILLYVSDGYDLDDGETLERLRALRDQAVRNNVPIAVLDPRLIARDQSPESVPSPFAWDQHWSRTRNSLRELASAGGVVQEPGETLADLLPRVRALARAR